MKCRTIIYKIIPEQDEGVVTEMESLFLPGGGEGPSGFVTGLYGTRDTATALKQVYRQAGAAGKRVAIADIIVEVGDLPSNKTNEEMLPQTAVLSISRLSVAVRNIIKKALGVNTKNLNEIFQSGPEPFIKFWADPQLAHIKCLIWEMDYAPQGVKPTTLQVCTLRDKNVIEKVEPKNVFDLSPDVHIKTQD